MLDPTTLKMIQLLLAQLFGFALCTAGIYLFLRGVAGKTSMLMEGAGIKAKVTNAAPGIIICMIGAFYSEKQY